MRVVCMKYLKVGEYEPRVVRKGVEETTLDIPEGGVYWCICLGKGVEMDVGTQAEAEIISRLVRIEALLRRRLL
jgi:hypothetical protein